MSKKEAVGFSLDDLNLVGKSETPFEFEYINEKGEGSGLWFSVLGDNADTVRTYVAEMIDVRNKKEAYAQAAAQKSRDKVVEPVLTVENVKFGTRAAAVRLVGWRVVGDTNGLPAEAKERFQGMNVPYTAENGLKLCKQHPLVAAQIVEQSGNIGNFTTI